MVMRTPANTIAYSAVRFERGQHVEYASRGLLGNMVDRAPIGEGLRGGEAALHGSMEMLS